MKEKVIKFKQYLLEGNTQKKAAILAGINSKCTTYYINKYNLEVPEKFRHCKIDDEYFNIIDTEGKAYLLGFFIADGYIDGKRVRLNNSIDDIEVLEFFKKEIAPERKIQHSNKQTGTKFRKPQVHIGITSEPMVKVLNDKYGIKRNKTYNTNYCFNFDNIPDNLIRHFVRGYFDGDGGLSFNKTKTSVSFRFSFVFTSKIFCEQIADIFKNSFDILPVIREHEGKTINWFSLNFNCKRKLYYRAKEVYEYLYKDSTIYLNRKKVKFENYFEYRVNCARKECKVM